jgi:hypothetical protein
MKVGDKGFKVGDVVEVINDSKWKSYRILGLQFTVTQKDVDCFNGKTGFSTNGEVYMFEDNKYRVNFTLDMLKLVESKPEQYYTSMPNNVRIGDKFEVIGWTRIDKSYYEHGGVKIGEIVTYNKDDGTSSPAFRRETGGVVYLNWGWLKPVKKDGKYKVGAPVEAPQEVLFGRDSLQQFNVGDEVELIEKFNVLKAGHKGIIKSVNIEDKSVYVDFENYSSNTYIYARRLKLINNSSNLNTNNNGKVHSNIESIVFSPIIAAITTGSTPRGIVISGSRKEITLGS